MILPPRSELPDWKLVSDWRLIEQQFVSEVQRWEVKPPAERKQPLTERERQVLDIIAAQSEGKGISGRGIIAEVRHRHNRVLEQSTLSGRIVPRLKHYGVRNRPRVGYYVNRT